MITQGSNGLTEVLIQDTISETVDLYLQTDTLCPSITVNTSIDDTAITVDDITNVLANDVITIYEGKRHFQSLITSVVDTDGVYTINLQSPLDFAFTTSAETCCGKWNLNLNGSITAIKSRLKIPPEAKFDIYSIRVVMLDQSPMDDAKFGGLTALTNGILFRRIDGVVKNLPLIVNNSGFKEIGFEIDYSDKAPAGYYGLKARKSYPEINGTALRFSGLTDDELQCWIRDNLTDLDQISIIVSGHLVEGD